MSSVDDFIKTLSPEEREKHKALIEECRVRELNIKLAREKGLSSAEQYSKSNRQLGEALYALHKKSNEALNAVSDASLNLTLLSFERYRNQK